MRAWQALLPAASLLLSAASCATYELDVPANASGPLPDYVGRPCEDVANGAVSVRTLDGAPRWHATGPGTVYAKCAKGTLKLHAVPVARLVIEVDPPLRLSRHTEFSLRAHGETKGGERVELSLLREDEIAWEHPPEVELNRPRCGHMVPLCVGSVGNGHVMRARVVGDAPVPITIKAAGLSQTVMLTPPAKE
jgi:hypothetical protein